MSLTYDTREEMETRSRRGKLPERAEKSGAEITLGTRSLLGIFFGLVLICGIFFGLGYSVGRVGSSHDTTASTDAPGPAADSHLQKPSAGQQTLTPVTTTTPDTGDTQSAPGGTTNPPAQNGTNPAVTTVVEDTSAPAKTGTAPAPAPALTPAVVTQPVAAPGGTGSFMVQVAAVRVQQDADILVSALKKRGFSAVVRNEPQDALLHVQLGPFASRADAMTMRSRLLAEGYNAVVK